MHKMEGFEKLTTIMREHHDEGLEDNYLLQTPSNLGGEEARRVSATISLEDCTFDGPLNVADERNGFERGSCELGNETNQVNMPHTNEANASPRSVACTLECIQDASGEDPFFEGQENNHTGRSKSMTPYENNPAMDEAWLDVELLNERGAQEIDSVSPVYRRSVGVFLANEKKDINVEEHLVDVRRVTGSDNFDVEQPNLADGMGGYKRIVNGLAVHGKETLVGTNLDTEGSQAILDVVKQAEGRDEENEYLNHSPRPFVMEHDLTPAEVVSIQEGDHTDDEDITIDLIGQARREMQALQQFIESQGSRRQLQDDAEQARSASAGELSISSPDRTDERECSKSALDDTRNKTKLSSVLLGVLVLVLLIAVLIISLFATDVLPRGDNHSEGPTNDVGKVPTSNTAPPTAASTFPCSQANWTQLGDSITGTTDGEFLGTAVAMSADGLRIAVASSSSGSGNNSNGYIQVYEFDGGNWMHLGDAIEGMEQTDGTGFAMRSISISYDGSVLAIGSPGANLVRVLRWLNGAWIQAGNTINGTVVNGTSQAFGYALALSGDGSTVAVSALEENANATEGVVHTYKYDGGLEWIQTSAAISSNEQDDEMGSTLALNYDGTVLAIGAPRHADNLGVVYEYKLEDGTWSIFGQPVMGIEPQARFGSSVDLSKSGDILAIGVPGSDAVSNNSGVALAFEFDGTSWNPVGGALAGSNTDDQVGKSVAITADGTRFGAGGYAVVAVAAILDETTGQWVPLGQTIEPEVVTGSPEPLASEYAFAFSRDGSTLAYGDRNFNNTGQVRIFQLANCDPLAT